MKAKVVLTGRGAPWIVIFTRLAAFMCLLGYRALRYLNIILGVPVGNRQTQTEKSR